MLPQKTFFVKDCTLYESDFDVTSNVKPHRVLELMQDAATTHADSLGIGWDDMDKVGLFWILSKTKVVFHRPLDRKVRNFKLYTWPLAANRLYLERRFKAVDDKNEALFSSSTLWMILDKNSRKIASRDVIGQHYDFDFDTAECGCDANFDRVRLDDSYTFAYESSVRRTQLDINKHVNNTNYINFALDVLNETDKVSALEIVYHKEMTLGDDVKVYAKRCDNAVYVVGERNAETCFTVKLTLKN